MAKKKKQETQEINYEELDSDLFEEVGTYEQEEYDNYDESDESYNTKDSDETEQTRDRDESSYDPSMYEPEYPQEDSQEMIDNVDSMVETHRIHSEEKGHVQGLMKPSECVSGDRCTVIRKNRRLEDQIKDKQTKYSQVLRENEQLVRALKNKLSQRDLQNLTLEAIKSPEVQSLKEHNLSLQEHIKERDNKILELRKQIKELKAERKDYYTNAELDRRYIQKKNQLKYMTRQLDLLLSREDDLKARVHNVELKHDKLVEVHNEKIRELNTLKRKIKDSKTILKKGISLKPLNTGGEKKGGIKRIIPWPGRD